MKSLKKFNELKKWLENAMGFKNFKWYSLINNYGYSFDYLDDHFDLRHWLNCYGENVDYWTIYTRELGNLTSEGIKKFYGEELQQLIKFIINEDEKGEI